MCFNILLFLKIDQIIVKKKFFICRINIDQFSHEI